MVGKNSAELFLPSKLSRLHPVINVALLMPFIADKTLDKTQVSDTTNSFLQDFVGWASSTYILEYRYVSPNIHKYLIRDEDASRLNDEWKSLTILSPNLDSFLREFHRVTPSRGPGPSLRIWESRDGLQV